VAEKQPDGVADDLGQEPIAGVAGANGAWSSHPTTHTGSAAQADATRQVDGAVAAAFAHNGPVPVDAVVNRIELAMPPSVAVEMAKGFTLYMVKALISGRADEVIDLAGTSLWR
jgi:hypothetical protein